MGKEKLSKAQFERLKKKERKKRQQESKQEHKRLLEEWERRVDDEKKADESTEVDIEYIEVDPFANIGAAEGQSLENLNELKEVFERFKPSAQLTVVPGEKGTAPQEEEKKEKKEAKLSKKKRKMLRRVNISVLKQVVKRPDLVEVHDTCSTYPYALMHLKAYRNAVPIPRHWSQRKRYLQNKRGIEKPPFALPDFIQRTGIMEIRGASQSRDASATLKAKTRDRVRGNSARIDIDYQTLHDAFFKHQTKPHLTDFGDIYYEGKEFEVEMKEKRPGVLSTQLKEALGMPSNAPPPWLFNMQRLGPPPSYPNLKIPGLNAPIPPGAEWGFHPGGWGQPPIDPRTNQPLFLGFGDEEEIQTIETVHWGDLEEGVPVDEPEGEGSAESGSEEGSEEESDDMVVVEARQPAQGPTEDLEGAMTPLAGIQTPLAGLETPQNLEGALRKKRKEEGEKNLYEVLQEKESSVGSSIMGSSHVYDLKKPGPEAPLESLTEDHLVKQASTTVESKKRKREDEENEQKKKKKLKDFKF